MRSAAFAIAALGGCSFTHGSATMVEDAAVTSDVGIDMATPLDAASDAPPPNFHLHVEADIDGVSHLILMGTTVKWHHYDFAAPGREGGTTIPTKLDTVDWFPTWPDLPSAENRDCNCDSSVYSPLPIGIPSAPSTTALSNIVARKTISIVTMPMPGNNYTLELKFDDVGSSGSATYKVDIDVVVQL